MTIGPGEIAFACFAIAGLGALFLLGYMTGWQRGWKAALSANTDL